MYYLIISAGLAVLVLLMALVTVGNKLHEVTDERDTVKGLLESQHQVNEVLDSVDTMSADAVTIWLHNNDSFADQDSDVPSVESHQTTPD